MKTFRYTIQDPLGIHARPAGLLSKEAKQYLSTITVSNNDSVPGVDVRRLMAIMGLCIKGGDTVLVSAEGQDEDTAIDGIKAFFENNL